MLLLKTEPPTPPVGGDQIQFLRRPGAALIFTEEEKKEIKALEKELEQYRAESKARLLKPPGR